MTQTPGMPTPLRVADLPTGRPVPFDISPDSATLAALGDDLGLIALKKLRFAGTLRTDGRSDWRLDAHLGGTVVQPCVVSLEPVTTRIERDISRRFVKDWPGVDEAEEVEMPEDDSIDPLTDTIDLAAILSEALALSLPDYPRHESASLEQTGFAPPGADPITDADVKPFAGLADLKRKLEEDDPD